VQPTDHHESSRRTGESGLRFEDGLNSSIQELLLLFSGGLLAGVLGGLLGIGGGIIIMPLLRFVFGLSPAHAAGNCILAVFFTTVGGGYRHYRLGNVHLRSLTPVIVSGSLACGLFSLLFTWFAKQESWLDLGIGLIFLLISARMIAEGIPSLGNQKSDASVSSEIEGTLSQKLSIGALAGLLPGLLGIGTGGILVPAFSCFLRASVKIAAAASLVCFCVNAFISSVLKSAHGFVDLEVALPMCIGTLIGANLGALLNKRFRSGTIKLLFGLTFSYVSLKFVFSFFQVRI
jgi:uncharacterized membrane protein YfcA